jgi:hypothetical protein
VKTGTETETTRPCDVCLWAKGDSSPKPTVAYCGLCGAWICDDCRPKWTLRGVAALKRAMGLTGQLKKKE